jgi:hypothetical protein
VTFDVATGRKLRYLPVKSGGRWERVLGEHGTLSCTVPLTPDTVSLNLREATRAGRTGLACVEGRRVLHAGIIWERPGYDRDARTVELSAEGIGSYFDRRVVMPAAIAELDVHGVIDNEDPMWLLAFEGESFSNIIRGLVSEALAWPGASLPVVLPDLVPGDHAWTYKGYDLAWVWQRVSELSERQDGPEVRFDARFTSDGLGLEFPLVVGTDAHPDLAAPRPLRLNVNAPRGAVRGLTVKEDGTGLAGLGWGLGGRQDDKTVLVKVNDPWLVEHGFALMEHVDADRSTASNPDTIASWVGEVLQRRRRGSEEWALQVRRDRPLVGTYREGDHAEVKVKGDPYLPDDSYLQKIVSISGSNDSDWVDLGLREVVADGV